MAGTEFEGDWVIRLSREGSSVWRYAVKPALEEAIFGPDERDERVRASGLPRDHGPGHEPREVDAAALMPPATKCLAALLDLAEIVGSHRFHEVEENRFRAYLEQAFNGATKVIATLIGAKWGNDWPVVLAERGRGALEGLVARLKGADAAGRLSIDALAPLEEACVALHAPRRSSLHDGWHRGESVVAG